MRQFIQVVDAVQLPDGSFLAELYTHDQWAGHHTGPDTFSCEAAILTASHGGLKFVEGNAERYSAVCVPDPDATINIRLRPDIAAKWNTRCAKRTEAFSWGFPEQAGRFERLHERKRAKEEREMWATLSTKRLTPLRKYRAGRWDIVFLPGRNVVIVTDGKIKAIVQTRDFPQFARTASYTASTAEIHPAFGGLEKLAVIVR